MLKQARDLYSTLKWLFFSPVLSLSALSQSVWSSQICRAMYSVHWTLLYELIRKENKHKVEGLIPFIKVSLTCIHLINQVSSSQFLCFLAPTNSLQSSTVQAYEQNSSPAEGESDCPPSFSGWRAHPMYHTGNHKSLFTLTGSNSKAYFL